MSGARLKKAGMICPTCHAELLIDQDRDIVICQICEERIKPR